MDFYQVPNGFGWHGACHEPGSTDAGAKQQGFALDNEECEISSVR